MRDVDYVAVLFIVIGPVEEPVRLAPGLQLLVGQATGGAVLVARRVNAGVNDGPGKGAVLAHEAEEREGTVERESLEVQTQVVLGGLLTRPAGLNRARL